MSPKPIFAAPLPTLRWIRLATCSLLLATVAHASPPLRVGIDLDGDPMTFVDSKGVPRGFAVDIMRAVAREMQFDVEFVARPWPAMYEDFKAGRVDALANITYTDERAQLMAFSAPHIVMKGAVFVRQNLRPIRAPIELRDLRVAVKLGGAPHLYLLAHGWAEHIVASPTLLESLRAVAEHRADAALDARLVGLKLLRDERLPGVDLSDVALTDFAQRLHAAFHLDNPAAVAVYNEGLARLHTNGTYDRLYDQWIDPLEPNRVRLHQLKPYLWPAALLLATVIGALVWQRRMLRRLAEQTAALHRGEERLTLVLEGTDDGFWDWDLRTNRVDRSERWAAMLGYTLAEIPPTLEAGRALVHPEDRHAYALIDARLKPGDSPPRDLEYRMRTKSGEWRWILNRGKVVARAPDGAALRMAGTHTDITDLRHAREEASRQAARFRLVCEHAPVGLSWMRFGEPETRLVNPAYERITGVSAARGREPGAYLAATHPDDRARHTEIEGKLRRGEIKQATVETRYLHPDGHIVWAILSLHLLEDAVLGEVYKLTTLVDISDRKRNEAEREALGTKMLEAQKLESLGVLAGGIAHDFNNLLTVILANATFARDDGQFTEERVAPIETAARRAADLCRQMLAYAGKGSVLLEQVCIAALLRETAELLHVSISKKARLQLDLASELPFVEADASQLRQVVMNLVINASESLGDSPGEIRLIARRGRPAAVSGVATYSFELPPGDCVCLEVSDTGHGMSPATLSRIFDPFFTTKFTGRGLGLAAVLGIVRAHRGALTVDSTVGRGTTFRLYLPASRRASPAGASSSPRTSPPMEASRGTILIADDEPSVLATVDIMIRRQGYRTVLAANGDEAVQLFKDNPDGFTAVILDLTMPGRDGAEVLAAIRAERAFMRVLVMSGFSEADIIERLRGCGEVVTLRKPFTQETLLERLTDTLAGPRFD